MDPTTSIWTFVGSGIFSAGIAYGVGRFQLHTHEVRLQKIETELGTVTGDVREIKTDVKWLCRYLGKRPTDGGE